MPLHFSKSHSHLHVPKSTFLFYPHILRKLFLCLKWLLFPVRWKCSEFSLLSFPPHPPALFCFQNSQPFSSHCWELPPATSGSIGHSMTHYFQIGEILQEFYPGEQIFPNLANDRSLVPLSDRFHLIVQCNLKTRKKRQILLTWAGLMFSI